MTTGFVLRVIFHLAPKQATSPSPAIEHNAIQKRLIFCRHDQGIVLIRFFCPRRAPMQNECFESEFLELRANVPRVVRADALLLHPNMDQVIVNRGITRDPVVPRALPRCAMGRFGEYRRFAWIDRMRGKPDERVGKIDNRFLVLGKQRVCADDEGEDQRASEIHGLTLNKKGQAAKATWPFCRNNPWTGKFR